MQIGLDLRLLGKRHGGIGRYTFEIATHILALDQGNRYTLFYNKKTADDSDVASLKKFQNTTLVSTNARHYSVAEQTSFLRTLNKYDLDLVHFPNFNVPIFYKRPFVVTIHDVVHHKISGAKKTHFLHFYAYKKVIETAVKNSRNIITVSEYSKKDIIHMLKVHPEKVSVIYEGTQLLKNEPQEAINHVKNAYLINKPYFLFVGVMERKKNLINLTRGFDLFLTKYKLEMDLVVVGKIDKHYPDIQHEAMDIQHKGNLVFTGYVEDRELTALYQGAYAYCNASLHEGFGLPGVEAMQFGLPLLVSNIPVFNEIYDNAAVYFDPLDLDDIAEKMHLLARDAQFHMLLQKNSLARAGLFSWEKAARETLDIYKHAGEEQHKGTSI